MQTVSAKQKVWQLQRYRRALPDLSLLKHQWERTGEEFCSPQVSDEEGGKIVKNTEHVQGMGSALPTGATG